MARVVRGSGRWNPRPAPRTTGTKRYIITVNEEPGLYPSEDLYPSDQTYPEAP